MDLVGVLPAFILAVLLISASPGPAMALIFRRAALHGFRGAIPTVLGLELGIYLLALLAGAGLAALVAASEAAFIGLRVLGGGVLLFLGFKAWRLLWLERRRRHGAGPDGEGPATEARVAVARPRWWRSFVEGAVVMLANPKAAVFMIAFYPQFVPADRPLLTTTAVLALAHVSVETVFYLSLAAAVGRAGTWFRRPVIRRRLEAVSGAVFIALGVRLAATSAR